MNPKVYDAMCKHVLSNVRNLSILLKYCIPEVESYEIEEIERMILDIETDKTPVLDTSYILGLNTEDIQDGNLIRFDIRFRLCIPDGEVIYVDVEIQNGNLYENLYPRANYYVARMLSGQYGIEFDARSYRNIKKSYSIWIMPLSTKEKDGCMERIVQDLKQFPCTLETDNRNYAKMEIVALYTYKFRNANGIFEKYPYNDGIMSPITLFFTNNITDIEEKKRLLTGYGFVYDEKEVDDMCGMSAGLAEVWREEGIEIGKEEGIEIGKEEGIEKRTRDIIQTLIHKGFTLFQIFDLLDFTDEEIKTYQNILMNE